MIALAHKGPKLTADPVASAIAVGLRYVSDHMPGIRREKSGKGFRYRYPTGEIVSDEAVLGRIKSVVIPPAWVDIWICPDPAGHLQATGRDQRSRKQHRYHPRWREIRDETKFTRMIEFGKVLPALRQRVNNDLAQQGLSKSKVLATVVRLLEVSLIRVGNEEYARDNESFGLTTMRDKHVDIKGQQVTFHFRGKSGKWHEVNVRDERLARIIKRCQDIPGQDLFQYVDENGDRQQINSTDVNEYLRDITAKDFTAKDFRTWAGTVLAAIALRAFESTQTKAQAKKNLVLAIESVAQRLGNTPAICKKSYVHPEIIEAYMDGTLADVVKRRAEKQLRRSGRSLPLDEARVLELLKHRLARGDQTGVQLKKSLARVKSNGGPP